MSSFKFEAWPTEFRTITQYFGANPQNYAQFKLPGHEGLDIRAPQRSKIFAVAPGIVKMVHKNPNDHNYGVHVRISHDEGYETIYAHLDEAHVKEGQPVKAGQVIGLADDTGNSFGSHLHLTLKKEGAQQGNWPANIIDPTPFMLPLMGWDRPAGPYTDGWLYTNGLITNESLGQVSAGGLNLRKRPSVHAEQIDLVPGGTVVILKGEKQGSYTAVKVPTRALENASTPPPPNPEPKPPVTVAVIDGWGWAPYLSVTGDRAVVGEYGINLRVSPERSAPNIGLVKGLSSVEITGDQVGEYLPVRVARIYFSGPINVPDLPPEPTSEEAETPDGILLGWAWTPYLTLAGRLATIGRFGINLRSKPSQAGDNLGLVKGGSTVTVVGENEDEYTPVYVNSQDVLNAPDKLPAVQKPRPFPAGGGPEPAEKPVHDTTPGWAFTTQLSFDGETAVVGLYGINLRAAPTRNAAAKGFVPAGEEIIVTGKPTGEYTPVRVDDNLLQPPIQAPDHVDLPAPAPDPIPLARALIGLHASADPGISQEEIETFKQLRPGVIKLLSFHEPKAIEKLAQTHAGATWLVRAFLDFGGRDLSPDDFFKFTISDMRRTLDILKGEDVVVELHNEPNLTDEGLGSSWANGADFAKWWLELLRLYRKVLPNLPYIYPGLSPGSDITNRKEDHVRFVEASRAAVEAADGLGVHLYWSNIYPMERSLDVLDDYISRFRFKHIWVTEASNNKSGTSDYQKARQYLKFWQELQARPTVKGVTYFVASASNKNFASEVFVGTNMAEVIGRR